MNLLLQLLIEVWSGKRTDFGFLVLRIPIFRIFQSIDQHVLECIVDLFLHDNAFGARPSLASIKLL